MNDSWKLTVADTEQDYKHLAGLYWLAFLLTGNQEVSVTMVIDAYESLDPACALRRACVRAELRKSVIERALAVGVIEADIVPAVTNHSLALAPGADMRSTDMNWEQLKTALLLLDLFPRRILLLSVFEGYTVRQTACLLATDVNEVVDLRSTALSDLTGLLCASQDRKHCSL